ncbi:mediator of DNA damage checkpoint protein 1-like [Atheta coriaria]|uniref:mediator of DNA damage checkpoint protein 1-like n=1 Tax=Dalotia coriaria TaxID=877792 RepID=UPI0031F3E6F9
MTQSTLELLKEFAKSTKEKSITGAKSDEEVLEESEILPNDGYGSDESIDFLAGMGNSTLETINAYARILNERNKIENSEKEAIAESAKILPESDDEGIVKQKVRSSVRRSRFIISDSEDSAGEEVETKITEPKTIENSVLSDCEDSFVARKSIGNASLDYIPATQDASFSRPSDVAYKLGLSRVQELCESGDISALQISTTEKDESVINDSTVGEKDNMPNESLHDTPRKSFDNESQEFVVQKVNSNVVRDTESTDFLVPTQPICKRTRSSVGLNSSDLIPATQDVCDDVDFDAPTQPILKTKPGVVQNGMVDEDVDFSAPTQPIIASECNALTFDNESEVFCMPTQPVAEFAKSKKGSRNSGNTSKLTQSENFDFDAPTQKVCDNVFNAETQNLNDDDFDAPTQPLEAPALCAEQEKDDIDFEAPTQPIIQAAKTVPVPHIEEETDFESPTQPIMRNDNDSVISEPHPVMKRVQEIESQLEVLFETQNVTLSTADSSRPTNPLASLIETCSTQDVISSLTGGGTKRSSDEFDVNGQSKRAKTSETPKAKTTSKLKSIDTPEVDNSRKSTIKEMDVTNLETNRNKSILDFFGKASSTMIENSVNGKVSSKLSMIKKQIATDVLDESEHSVSNVEVECLADTIPMVAMEHIDISKDSKTVEDQTLAGDKTFDTTAARKKKRKLLDEETMCSMPTPEPVKTIDLTDDDKKEIKSTETPKACIKKTKATAKTNTTKRNTRQTRGSVRFEESSDDSDEECKVVTKKTRGRPPTNVRASTRAKKSVNYKENHEKSKSTRSHQNNSSDSEKEDKRIIITVPEKQIKLVITDEEDLKKKEIKSDIKKVSRSSKIKEEVTMSPERSKRVTKPKVIFTMLDDPKLKQIVRSLGGSIVEKIAQSTVLVTEKVQRTLKLLSAIGRSIPICSPEWLMECKKAHAFLDPWDYLIKDPDAEKMWKFKIGQTLEMSKRSKIFAGIQFLLVTTLSVDVIKGGIEANGGKVVTRKPANDNFIVVGDAAHQSKYATYLKSKVKVVSAEAILVGILRQEIAFDEFALS